MIFGIGTDICDVRRIQSRLERHGEGFVSKILTSTEFAIWQSRRAQRPERGVRYLASRFSAKEAFSKAIGLGMITPMSWQLCEVATLASGQPVLVLHGALQDWFNAHALSAHLSITDEVDYAVSFCVVEVLDKKCF